MKFLVYLLIDILVYPGVYGYPQIFFVFLRIILISIDY